LERNLSYSELIAQAGLRPSRTFLGMERSEANDTESELLLLPIDEPVVRIERVRSADGQPVIYSVDSIPERYVKGRPDRDLKGSLYELFKRIGCTIAHGEATLAPVLADAKLAECLQVDVGSPLLRIFQVDYTTAGEAVMFSREWHVPGVFELSLLRRSP
jgi:GntR family transcriptional regulator